MKTQYEVHPLIQITGTQRCGKKKQLTESIATPNLSEQSLHGYTEQDDFVASYIALKNNIPIFSREKKGKYINGMYDTKYIPKNILNNNLSELKTMLNKMKLIPVTLFQYNPIVLGKDQERIVSETERYGYNSYINPKDISEEFLNLFKQKAKRECSTSHKLVASEYLEKKCIFEYKAKNYSCLNNTEAGYETTFDNSLKNSFIKETFNACTSSEVLDKSADYNFVVDGLNMLHGSYHPNQSYRINMEKIASAYRESHPEYKGKYLECLLVLRGPICDNAGFYPGGITRDKIMKPFSSCRKLKAMKDKWSCKELSFNVGRAKVYVDVLYVWQTIEIPSTWINEWHTNNTFDMINPKSFQLIETNSCSFDLKYDKITQEDCYTGVKQEYNILHDITETITDNNRWEKVKPKKRRNKYCKKKLKYLLQ
jgi:hypothetical protein